MGACSTIEDVGHLVRLLEESADLPTALAAFQREREGDVTAIEKTGRRNERMMMPANPLLYWARNEVLGHTPDEKLLQIAEEMTTAES
jgi:2-polyprenyl-6-methoxyphenol hydroxylase-like FAD-dependent oxidoreductase